MAEVHEILRQTAGMVASELSDAEGVWKADSTARTVVLVRPDGARLSFGTVDPYTVDKLRISGRYPDGVLGSNGMYGLEHARIGVARERGPRAIAREIERRLLPAYLPELRRAQAWLAERHADEAVRDAVVRELSAIAGNAPGMHAPYTVGVPGSGGRLEVQLGGRVRVERLVLGPEEAAELLRMLVRERATTA
jgi:hypothetical protein